MLLLLSFAHAASHPGECTSADDATNCGTAHFPGRDPYCYCKIKIAECSFAPDPDGTGTTCTASPSAGSYVCEAGGATARHDGVAWGGESSMPGYFEDYTWNSCEQVRAGRATTTQLSTFAGDQAVQLLGLLDMAVEALFLAWDDLDAAGAELDALLFDYAALETENAALTAEVERQAAEIATLEAELEALNGGACDGALCADGRCVATPEECTSER